MPFPDYLSTFPHPRTTGSPQHLTHGPYPSPGRAPSAIYLCIYLFIYLLFYLISWLHPGTVWLSQLDWEVEEQGQQGHSSLWVWGEDHPFQRPELLRTRPGEMGGGGGRSLLILSWQRRGHQKVLFRGRSPASEPSTPVPGSPSGLSSFVSYLFLFQRDPRFQGPTEPRTPLGPLACSREECSLPATTMQLSRAEGPGLPARRLLATTTSSTALLHARARTEAHTSARTGPAPSALSTHLYPHPSVSSLGTRVLDTQTSSPSP